jgi:hypothetical protein
MKSISNKTKIKLTKKYKKGKISKKQPKLKNKKSLKLVKNVQKGGVPNEEVFITIREKTKMHFEKDYPACFSLIREFSQSPEQLQPRFKMDGTPLGQVDFWTYEAKIKPTPDFEIIFEDPLKWYKSKNPEFKILKKPTEEEIPILPFNYNPNMYIGDENQVRVHEYKFLVAQMIKDLLLALYLGSMPKLHKNNISSIPGKIITNHANGKKLANMVLNNNTRESIKIKQEILKILIKIEQNISKEKDEDNYNYVQFIDYMCDCINIFSSIDFDSTSSKCFVRIMTLKKILFTPFIIFPTLIQVNFKKTLDLIRAPLLNLRLSNNRKKVHETFTNSCFEIGHDILFHCNLTHNIGFFIYESKREEIEYIYTNNILLQLYERINNYLLKIQSLYNYKIKNEIYIYSIFLFYLLHEYFGVKIIINDDLLEYVKKDKENILKKIREEYGSGINTVTIEGTNTKKQLTDIYDTFESELENILTQ